MITAYTDGAVRVSNPGMASCAWVLYKDGKEVTHESRYLGPELRTNNYAEYMALLDLLQYLCESHIRNVIIHCDSKLVVNQVNDMWDVNEQALIPLWVKAYGLLIHGCHVLKHVKGHDGNPGNEAVDRLCNDVLDQHKEEYETMATD